MALTQETDGQGVEYTRIPPGHRWDSAQLTTGTFTSLWAHLGISNESASTGAGPMSATVKQLEQGAVPTTPEMGAWFGASVGVPFTDPSKTLCVGVPPSINKGVSLVRLRANNTWGDATSVGAFADAADASVCYLYPYLGDGTVLTAKPIPNGPSEIWMWDTVTMPIVETKMGIIGLRFALQSGDLSVTITHLADIEDSRNGDSPEADVTADALVVARSATPKPDTFTVTGWGDDLPDRVFLRNPLLSHNLRGYYASFVAL